MLEKIIFTKLAPKAIHYIKPVEYLQAKGFVKKTYDQMQSEFQIVPPLTIHSPIPELLACIWTILRESLIAKGLVSRTTKEVVAVVISRINECPYCIDVHTSMLHGASKHGIADLIPDNLDYRISDKSVKGITSWASATKSPESPLLHNPPFLKKEAPEIIGTALSFHYINRMVNVFLSNSPVPIPSSFSHTTKIARRLFGAFIGKKIVNKTPEVKPGKSLHILPDSEIPEEFVWARPNPIITGAFARFANVITKIEERFIHKDVQEAVKEEIQRWNGEDRGISSRWTEEVIKYISDELKSTARLALLTAFASYHVDEGIVKAFRRDNRSDQELIAVTAWASFMAVQRINTWICGSSS